MKTVKGTVIPKGFVQHTLASEDDALDLSSVSTAELHAELVRRTGVRELVFGPEDNVLIAGNDGVILDDYGPVRVLINVD